MKYYQTMVVAVGVLGGCSLVEPLTYDKAPTFNHVQSHDVRLHNSQIDIDMSKSYSDIIIEQALQSLVARGGHRAKQRFVIFASKQGIASFRQRLTPLFFNVGILVSQLRFKESTDSTTQQLSIISEYFQANSIACEKSDRAILGCASSNLLSAMVVDPATLIRGKRLGPSDGVKAVNSVKTYQAVKKINNKNQSFRVSGGN